MKLLIADSDTVFIEHLRRLLAARGIGAFVRNATNSGSAAGELTPAIAPPELWVAPEDHAAAEHILHDVRKRFATPSGPAWRCPDCGEALEPQFEVCWRCGAERPQGTGGPKSGL